MIFLSLELHKQTLHNVGRLYETASRADERAGWFQRAEQCVLELNAPGNSIFETADPVAERVRLEQAHQRFAETINSGRQYSLQLATLEDCVGRMVASAKDVLSAFEKSIQQGADESAHRHYLQEASRAMARMDEYQTQAIRHIALLRNSDSLGQKTMVEQYEADVQSRIIYERYVIAAFLAILFGILWFGYRLQKTNQALIAERRLVEEERRERLAAIGELCSSVAHGIRNPLASIRSSAQLTMELGTLDNQSRDRLQDILDEGARLADRVTGMLNIARSNHSGFETLDLCSLVTDAVKEVQGEVSRLGLALTMDIITGPLPVLGDKRQLEQLVIELVSNAMEHSKPGGALGVRCGRPGNNGVAQISVEDSGEGVPEALQSRVFDLFFTTKSGGTGIGLATVKRIARLHGGDVALEPVKPHGARFVVSIPVSARSSGSQC